MWYALGVLLRLLAAVFIRLGANLVLSTTP